MIVNLDSNFPIALICNYNIIISLVLLLDIVSLDILVVF